MGRIKTAKIKRITFKLIKEYSDKLKKNFGENKKAVNEILEVRSKKLRNVIAGYATRLMQIEKKQ